MIRRVSTTSALFSITMLLVGLLALNTAAAFLLRGARLDLTEEGLFTISPAVGEMVRALDEPLRLDLYWTQQTGRNAPQLKAHAQRVREFLEEVALSSQGKVLLSMIDPEPFSLAEESARADGIASLSVDGTGGVVMLGLVVRGPTDAREVLPYLSPDQEGFLEYEVARAIMKVGRATRPKIGLLSTLPTEQQFDPRRPSAPTPAPIVFEQMRDLYEVAPIEASASEVPPEVEVLVLVHPRGLGEPLLRAIDSWAFAGKPILLFFDPWCETDPAAAQAFSGAERGGTSSDLGGLPAAWGFNIPTDVVVGDLTYATRIRTMGPAGSAQELNYVPWLSLSKSAFVADDPITGTLAMVNMMSAGSMLPAENATSTLTPLMESSADSMMIQCLKLGYFGDPDRLIRDHKPDGQRKTLAARVGGKIGRAYPDSTSEGSSDGGTNAAIVVINDADMLSDQTWIVEQSIGGVSLGARTIADNGALVLNALEVLTGNRALSELRSRGKYRRPFDVVEQMRKEAEGKYLRRSQELQDQIKQSEIKIAGLQRDEGAGGGLLLSSEQQLELASLNDQVVVARRELREVQHALREDIEWTGRMMMLLNVVIWPLAVAVLLTMWSLLASQLRGRR